MPEDQPNFDTTPRKSRQEDFYGTLYPYLDFKGGVVGNMMGPIRRALVSVNPFASQQIPSHDSVGMADRWGNGFYTPPNYLSNNVYSHLFPNHYDSLSNADPSKEPFDPVWSQVAGPGVRGKLGTYSETYPKGCSRQVQYYTRCKNVNGKEKCEQEMQNVLELCPNWCLEDMRQQKRFEKKVALIQREEYNQGMAVASYNEGRTMADVSNKTHVHGTRTYLRPDTLWADERYRDVTKDEVMAARERQETLLKAEGRWNTPLGHEHHYDTTGAQQKEAKPLY